jgi:tRNA(fMet)-specific endonuclease VapC
VTRGLLDTNAVILLALVDPSDLPEEAAISAVTLAELSVGPLVAPTESERAARQAHLQLADDFEVLAFDQAEARAFAEVALSLRRAGRKASSRAFDAMIAATAIANGLRLYSCNAADFEGIDRLQVVPIAPSPDG